MKTTNVFNLSLPEAPQFNQFKNIDEVWAAVESGTMVYASNKSYAVVVEQVIGSERTVAYQSKHFSYRNGKVLCTRCIENWFGSLMHESELGSLFTTEGK